MNDNATTWRIPREQATAIGVVIGFVVGLRAGEIIKVLAAVALFCAFALFGRAVERRFESRLGIAGFFGVVAVLSSLGDIRNTLEGVIEVILFIASIAGLAVLGGAAAMRLYDTVTESGTDTDAAE